MFMVLLSSPSSAKGIYASEGKLGEVQIRNAVVKLYTRWRYCRGAVSVRKQLRIPKTDHLR